MRYLKFICKSLQFSVSLLADPSTTLLPHHFLQNSWKSLFTLKTPDILIYSVEEIDLSQDADVTGMVRIRRRFLLLLPEIHLVQFPE